MIVKSIEQRVAEKVNAGMTADQAETAVTTEGAGAMDFMVGQAIAATTPKERVYKIKRSLKGARVKVAGFEGRSFSFGPIWVELVKKGKGPALTDQLKVRAHAAHLGVANATKGKFETVLAALQSKLA
jgi:hypothetical protein